MKVKYVRNYMLIFQISVLSLMLLSKYRFWQRQNTDFSLYTLFQYEYASISDFLFLLIFLIPIYFYWKRQKISFEKDRIIVSGLESRQIRFDEIQHLGYFHHAMEISTSTEKIRLNGSHISNEGAVREYISHRVGKPFEKVRLSWNMTWKVGLRLLFLLAFLFSSIYISRQEMFGESNLKYKFPFLKTKVVEIEGTTRMNKRCDLNQYRDETPYFHGQISLEEYPKQWFFYRDNRYLKDEIIQLSLDEKYVISKGDKVKIKIRPQDLDLIQRNIENGDTLESTFYYYYGISHNDTVLMEKCCLELQK